MSANFKEALSNRPQIAETNLTPANNEGNDVATNTSAGSQNGTAINLSTTTSPTNTPTSLTTQLDQPQADNQEETLNQTLENKEVITPAQRGASSEVAALLKQQADFLVTQANEHIANYRLKTPKSNSALGTLEQLQKIDPNNENIQIIREGIGKRYLSLASGKINKGQKSSAQKSLESAKEFITDDSLIAEYQTRINNIATAPAPTPTPSKSTTSSSASSQASSTALACNPTVKLAGIPLIGGQSLTAEQTLPLSVNSVLNKAFSAVQKDYENIKRSGKKITYEQSTQTKPIKFTLTVSKSGSGSNINIKAKTPAGILIKKSGYKQGFCELLAKF